MTQAFDIVENEPRKWVLQMLLHLLLITVEELTGEVKIGGSLGCSDHALVEIMILGDK